MTNACAPSAQLLAEMRAPRYTSYPTAAQFTTQIGADQQATWLSAVPDDTTVSLYVHVPYCRRLCWYCGCNARVANGRETVASFVDTLMTEIDAQAARIGGSLRTGFIHLGGGSPNVLGGVDLDRLFARLEARFSIASDAEIAAEVDPAHLGDSWISAAARNGVNRVSLGVQTFSSDVQEAINRRQTFSTVARAVARLRAEGIRTLSLDLMYGLPRQSVSDVIATVEQALVFSPDRVSVFGYAHVPWMKPHQELIDAAELPGAGARLQQSAAAAETLSAAGYVQIGMDHFAKPSDPLACAAAEGRLRRNFQGYTTDTAEVLLGFGPSAISRFPDGFVQNAATPLQWSATVHAGRLAGVRGVALGAEDRLRAAVIETLMCDRAIDLANLPRQADLSDALHRLRIFERQGLVERRAGQLRITPAGKPLVRTICTAFDVYFRAAPARHSVSV